jgi:hypothetical protein
MSHIFKTCPVGHDLTVKDAYIYQPNGSRVCRACVYEEQRNKRKPKTVDRDRKGAFNE